jgi:hypothetical protein
MPPGALLKVLSFGLYKHVCITFQPTLVHIFLHFLQNVIKKLMNCCCMPFVSWTVFVCGPVAESLQRLCGSKNMIRKQRS